MASSKDHLPTARGYEKDINSCLPPRGLELDTSCVVLAHPVPSSREESLFYLVRPRVERQPSQQATPGKRQSDFVINHSCSIHQVGGVGRSVMESSQLIFLIRMVSTGRVKTTGWMRSGMEAGSISKYNKFILPYKYNMMEQSMRLVFDNHIIGYKRQQL